MGQVRDSVHHFLNRRRVRVIQSSRFRRSHHRFQQITQDITGVHDAVGHFGSGRLAGQSVPDEDQFVSAQDDKLTVRYEDPGRLSGADAAEKGVHGAEKSDEMLLALLGVEDEELAVPGRELRGRGFGLRGGGPT